MTVDAVLGIGSRLYYSADNVTYTELTDIVEIGPPDDPDVERIEATPLNPNSRAKEYLFGLVEYGEFTFKQFWNKTRYNTLRGFLYTSKYWKVVFPDTSTLIFQGALTKCRSSGLTNNQPIHIECTVKISGATTFTAAA